MMANSSHSKRILQLAWPILIGQLAVMLNGLIDTAMAGHLSAADLAAVGLGTSIYISVYIGLMGTLQALGPIAAAHFGAQAMPEIGRTVRQSYWVALLLAVCGCILLGLPEVWLALIQPTPVVGEKIRAYLYAVSFGLPAALLFRVFYALNTAVARPRVVMTINLCGLAVKPLLNWLLMYHWQLGGPGCAIATAVISWFSVLLFIWFARHDEMYQSLGLWRIEMPNRVRITELLKLGLPIGLSYFIEVTAFTFMALFIGRFTVEQSGGHQIIANLCGIAYMLPLALANASSILVAQALGAQRQQQAQQIVYAALRLGLGASMLLASGLWFGQHAIVNIYTSVANVQAVALSLFGWLVWYHLCDATQCILGFLLRAYRSTTIPMLIYGICCWGIGLGGGYMLAFQTQQWQGARGFWLAGVLSLFLTSALLGWVLQRKLNLSFQAKQ